MKTKPTLLLGFFVVLSALPLWAHHSFATQYDTDKPITIKGSVMMLDLVNPHSWLYLNVKGAKGELVNWGIELGPIRDLQVQGWDKTTVKPGTEVSVEGFPAKTAPRPSARRS